MHTWGKGGDEKGPPPPAKFQKLINKNAIKCKIVYPFLDFVQKAWTPGGVWRGLSKNLRYKIP
jgi:hypothetical protein